MKTDSVSLQMEELLDEVSQEVQEATDEGIRKTADDAVQMLRNTSPRSKGPNGGRYAKGWAVKATGPWSRVVYNKTDWQLTHLLENGHIVKPHPKHPGKKNRVEGIKHIAPVEEWAADELPIRISRGLS